MKQTGVWIDNKQAVIVKLAGKKESTFKIQSGIVFRERIPGEVKQFTRMGKQFFTFEKTKKEKRKNELRNYFRRVIQKIKDTDELLIMGPAGAKTGLDKELGKAGITFSTPVRMLSADSMTDNQIAAKIRNYFNKKKKSKR